MKWLDLCEKMLYLSIFVKVAKRDSTFNLIELGNEMKTERAQKKY